MEKLVREYSDKYNKSTGINKNLVNYWETILKAFALKLAKFEFSQQNRGPEPACKKVMSVIRTYDGCYSYRKEQIQALIEALGDEPAGLINLFTEKNTEFSTYQFKKSQYISNQKTQLAKKLAKEFFGKGTEEHKKKIREIESKIKLAQEKLRKLAK